MTECMTQTYMTLTWPGICYAAGLMWLSSVEPAALWTIAEAMSLQAINSRLWGPLTWQEYITIHAFQQATTLVGAACWQAICETVLPYRLPGILHSLWECQLMQDWKGQTLNS